MPGGAPTAGGIPGGAAISEDARLYGVLLSNLDGMVYRCRDDEHWTMEYVSEGCVRLLGYRPEDLTLNSRVSYEEVTHPEDRDRVREVIHEGLRRQDRYSVEYRVRCADGTVRWVWERGAGVYGPDGRFTGIEGFIQDITERRRVEEALQEAERRYRSIFENAVEGIFQTTPDGRYLAVNPALARMHGYESPEAMVASLQDISRQVYVQPGRRDEFLALIERDGRVTGFESEVYRRSGEIIWVSENAHAVYGEDGRPVMFEGTGEDITERKRYQAEVEHQATHDALTGLPNRVLFRDRLRQALLYAQRASTRVAVAFVDLDRFKVINDSLGHHVGDRLLETMAERLRTHLREADTVARHGGDEFVLLLAGQSGREAIRQALERVLAAVSEPCEIEGREFNLSCSIGISVFPDDGSDVDTLLKHADLAMYKAKETGRDRLKFYTPELNVAANERLEFETRLRRALEWDQLVLHYQPKLDLASGGLSGAEALLRWRTPDFGMVPPARFIPIAEETGLIVPIGRWVLEAACQQNAAWRKRGLPPVVVSVNVSIRQFQRDDIIDAVARSLEASGLEPHYLELELTESLVMHDAEKVAATLRALKRLGVQISVDDFGTGYSSLNYLKRFPVDRLKIDQSFVHDIMLDADSATIVNAIVTLGHSLGLKVIAEGVETQAQYDYLVAHQCDEVQGYYLGRPVDAAEFERRWGPGD